MPALGDCAVRGADRLCAGAETGGLGFRRTNLIGLHQVADLLQQPLIELRIVRSRRLIGERLLGADLAVTVGVGGIEIAD